MDKLKIIFAVASCLLFNFASADAYGRKFLCSSSTSDFPRATDGSNGHPGYFEDGGDGQNGEIGKNGKDGGHGGDGGESVYGNGGNGGNGGDAE
jgi:hypothetical protein